MSNHDDGNNTGRSLEVKNAMSEMQAARRRLEREDTIEATDAIAAAAQSIATEKHEELLVQAAGDPLATAALEVMSSEVPKKSLQESTEAAANVVIQQMQEENIMPKASDSIAVEDDVDALINMMEKTTAKKPISAHYLRMLEMQKRGQQSPSKHRRGRSTNSTELCKLSQLLRSVDSTRTGDRISQSAFKSHYQEMLYKSMRKARGPPSATGRQDKAQVYDRLHPSRSSHIDIDELCDQRRSRDRRAMYSSLEDAKHCTFRPRTNETRRKAQASRDDDDDDAAAKDADGDNFINRQEAKYRAHLDDLEREMCKKEYEAVVDKKYCPRCGAKQSYDEVRDKRKRCEGCGELYRRKIAWGDIGPSFLKRQSKAHEQSRQKRVETATRLWEDQMTVRRKRIDGRTGKLIVEDVSVMSGHLKWTPAMEEEFLNRQVYWEEVRQRDVKKAELEMYGHHRSDSKTPRRGNRHEEFSFLDSEETGGGTNRFDRKWTAQMEQDFLNRQEYWEDVRQRDLDRVEYEMYGQFEVPSLSRSSRTRREFSRSEYRDPNEETFAEHLYHN